MLFVTALCFCLLFFVCVISLNCRYNRFILEERRKAQAEKFARRQKRREKKLKKLRKQEDSVEGVEIEVNECGLFGALILFGQWRHL